MPKYGGIHGQVDAARLEELIEMYAQIKRLDAKLTLALRSGNMFAIMDVHADLGEFLALKEISYPYWVKQLESWEAESDQ